jgi:multiple sugar transport system substrate-binding protein
MPDLTFSLTPTDAIAEDRLQQVLDNHERRTHTRVHLHKTTPQSAQQDLNSFALHKMGADVSQMGSTWLRGFIDMNALRSFNTLEASRMGSASQYIPACWESAHFPGQAQSTCWAIPWLADVRVLYYRRDLLEQAGVDEQNAFESVEALAETLERLQKSHVAAPWVVPTRFSWRTLHNVASWIWAAGGDFVSSDGKRMLLMEPTTLDGLKAYFSLSRFLSDEVCGLASTTEVNQRFLAGQVAVTLSSGYLLGAASPAIEPERVGFASPPGVSFIGGSLLVVWSHTLLEQQAVELVRYLTSPIVQQSYGLGSLLPVRLDALDALQTLTGQAGGFVRFLQETLHHGRSLPTIYLWNVIEGRLTSTLAQIWEEVLKSTQPDLDAVLEQYLTPLNRQLDMLLQNS